MSDRGFPISGRLRTAIQNLFEDSGPALRLLGTERPEFLANSFEETLPVDQDAPARASLLRAKLEMYVEQMSAESSELASEYETQRLRSEAIGLLLALRELHRHIPEAFDDV
jgi:hypothetical protein